MTVVRDTFCQGCMETTTHERVPGEHKIRCRECGRKKKGSVGIPG